MKGTNKTLCPISHEVIFTSFYLEITRTKQLQAAKCSMPVIGRCSALGRSQCHKENTNVECPSVFLCEPIHLNRASLSEFKECHVDRNMFCICSLLSSCMFKT